MHKADMLCQEKEAEALGYKTIAGIDEAGRGPLAGPVVAAAVILKEISFIARIDDSKKLTSLARERAYEEIFEKAFIGVGIVAEDMIDSLNIYRATRIAMEEAVLNLIPAPDFLLIDGIMPLRVTCAQRTIIAGDQKSLSIAAASIVAKVTRDRLLTFYDNIFPHYGFKRHKGYGTKEHISALKENGFSPIHRRTFTPHQLRTV